MNCSLCLMDYSIEDYIQIYSWPVKNIFLNLHPNCFFQMVGEDFFKTKKAYDPKYYIGYCIDPSHPKPACGFCLDGIPTMFEKTFIILNVSKGENIKAHFFHKECFERISGYK